MKPYDTFSVKGAPALRVYEDSWRSSDGWYYEARGNEKKLNMISLNLHLVHAHLHHSSKSLNTKDYVLDLDLRNNPP
jgi:hypothetical protein